MLRCFYSLILLLSLQILFGVYDAKAQIIIPNQIPNLLNKYKNIEQLSGLNDSDSKILLKQLYKYDQFALNKESYLKLL